MPDRPSQKALSDFVSEAQEAVDALEKDLVRLEDTRQGQEADPDTLNAVFRAAHSLKGLSAMFGVDRMARLAHALEDRLDDVRMGRRALDRATLDVLLAAPALFARIVAEEGARLPPETAEAAEALAARLHEAAAPPPRANAPEPAPEAAAIALDEGVRAMLTEYEEHRLKASLDRPGARLHRVRVRFDLATFDTGLEELKRRLKPLGEVISTLPSSDATDPGAIAFEVLFASSEPLERIRAAAGAGAVDEPRPPAPAPPQEAPPAPPAPPHLRPATEPPPIRAVPASPAAAAAEDPSLRSASQAVRVDIHKLDQLMNLVGELVLVKTSVLDIAERLRAGEDATTLGLELHRESRALERKLEELQGGILEVRMVPIGQVFDKLSRMVRKLAREIGKSIELEVRGSDVELDKLIVEDLSDPLMHLVRNALDHAIEAPDARLRAGKPAAGKLVLAAAQRGNHVCITVEDDGAGIDEARVREAAVARGVLTAEAAAQLARRDVLDLIFLPGFSTARQVTALSGRGVGMDVVKSNVAAMSGIIDLDTVPGEGTRFEITIPVTLAIVRALVVRAAERTYAVPLGSVLEIVSLDPREVRTIETREVFSLRGATVPLVRLERLFALQGGRKRGALFVVVVGLAKQRLGLAVDALVGQQDVVVKPLGRALAGVRGISGATDLGNRRTVLVLDVGAIIDEVTRDAPGEAAG